jgi:hypothetical protein
MIKFSVTAVLLISTLGSYAQNSFAPKQRQVEGVWKTQDQQDSLLLCVSGQSNPNVFVYFPSKAKFLPFRFSTTGDSMIHYENDGTTMVLTLSADGRTITDANGASSKMYARNGNADPVNSKSIPGSADDFFDYSTSNYYAGINFYMSPHPGLPFVPNNAFISKRKTNNIKIEKYFNRISSGGVQTYKEYDLEYNFNGNGHVSSVKVIPATSSQETDTWTFTYNGDKLQKIVSPARVLQFDNDNWEIDAKEQKKVPFIFPIWSYYSISQRPRTATLPYMTGAPLNEYFYNGQNQLVKICSKDLSEPNIIEHCTEYTYDKNGIPVRIVETKRSK